MNLKFHSIFKKNQKKNADAQKKHRHQEVYTSNFLYSHVVR